MGCSDHCRLHVGLAGGEVSGEHVRLNRESLIHSAQAFELELELDSNSSLEF